jgi:hypothetical protein
MGIATKNYVDVRLGMIHVKDTKPAVQENVLWWDNVEGQLYIQVYDLDYTYQWVQAVPDPYYMLKTTGGSMTGALLLAADPAQPLEAATKQYVDTAVAGGGAEPLAIPFSFPGKPAPGAIINIPVAFPIALGQWLGGSVSCSGVAATSAAKFRLFKVDAAGVETEIGAVDFDSSRPNGGWSGVSGSLATGEVLRMKAPDVQDATLADVGLTVWATRA